MNHWHIKGALTGSKHIYAHLRTESANGRWLFQVQVQRADGTILKLSVPFYSDVSRLSELSAEA